MGVKDIQNEIPKIRVSLNRVGSTGIKKQVVKRNGDEIKVFTPTIDAFVDLRGGQKGIHMSRIVEGINETIEELISEVSVYGDFEDICVGLARKMLEKHNYASRAEVRLKANFTVERKTPATGIETEEVHRLIANAVAEADEEVRVRKTIGCSVLGMNACPCAQSLVEGYSRKKLEENGFNAGEIEKILDALPMASHNQRVLGTLIAETDEDERVEARDLVKIIEDSISAEIFEILKRPDERDVVIKAHKNPLFVEDSVRRMLNNFYDKYNGKLNDNAVITSRIESFESIHPHNAFAESIATFSDLRGWFEK